MRLEVWMVDFFVCACCLVVEMVMAGMDRWWVSVGERTYVALSLGRRNRDVVRCSKIIDVELEEAISAKRIKNQSIRRLKKNLSRNRVKRINRNQKACPGKTVLKKAKYQ